MPKFVLFALLCMAAAGSACAQVYKSVGADGKVAYSDRPSDTVSSAISIIKADLVQTVSAPAAKVQHRADSAAVRLAVLAASAAAQADGKLKISDTSAPQQVCDQKIDVLVNRKGDIVKVLGPSGPLAAFKPH